MYNIEILWGENICLICALEGPIDLERNNLRIKVDVEGGGTRLWQLGIGVHT